MSTVAFKSVVTWLNTSTYPKSPCKEWKHRRPVAYKQPGGWVVSGITEPTWISFITHCKQHSIVLYCLRSCCCLYCSSFWVHPFSCTNVFTQLWRTRYINRLIGMNLNHSHSPQGGRRFHLSFGPISHSCFI